MLIGEIPEMLVQRLSALPQLGGICFVEAYPAKGKPFPLKKLLVSVQMDQVAVRPAELATDAFDAGIRIACAVHAPFSAGGAACREAAARLLHSLLFDAGLTVLEAGSGPVCVSRESDALCLEVWVSIDTAVTKEASQ